MRFWCVCFVACVLTGVAFPGEADKGNREKELAWAQGVAADFLEAGSMACGLGLLTPEQMTGRERQPDAIEMFGRLPRRSATITSAILSPDGHEAIFSAVVRYDTAGTRNEEMDVRLRLVKKPCEGVWQIRFMTFKVRAMNKDK